MQKLFKLPENFYVIDTEAVISVDDWVLDIVKMSLHQATSERLADIYNDEDECCRVVGTTNMTILAPFITNQASDLETLTGDEIEINFEICNADGCNGTGTYCTDFSEEICSYCNGTGLDLNSCTVKAVAKENKSCWHCAY